MIETEAPWLDDREKRAWTALSIMLTRLLPVMNSQLLRESGITHFEYVAMAALSSAPDHTMRMSELSTAAGAALPRLSQVVARLEKRGWVSRHPDPTDGRCVNVTLTESGLEKVTASAPGHVREVRRLVFDRLSDAEVDQLAGIGDRIITGIEA